MKIDKKYIMQIAESESIFDMAAICYRILEKEIVNPFLFISQYLDEDNEAEFNNPNFQRLREFSDHISKILEEYSELDFDGKKKCILNLLINLELACFMKKKENQLSALFVLLSTIDSLVPFWREMDIAETDSLNKGNSRNSHLVYLASNEYLHEDLIRKIGRNRKCSGGIGETLEHLVFLKKELLPRNAEIPKICFLSRRNPDNPWCLKVAAIMGLSGTHFEVVSTTGSTKIIRYINGKQEKVAREICCKMYDAIRQGAELILLPEFCVSEEILKYIKKKLAEWMTDETLDSHLIAVFPGSTWTDANDNVQFLLDAWGREIGQYYKNMPYRKKCKTGKGYESCEGLTHPGYRTSLLWVKDIGYLLPATCRDVLDGELTGYLIQSFQPTFLMVPAWSSSGSSFEPRLKKYAAEFFTNSVLCNACGALTGSASIVGGAAVMGKKETVAAGAFEPVRKSDVQSEKCVKECDRLCGCMMEMNFSPQNITLENRIRWWRL